MKSAKEIVCPVCEKPYASAYCPGCGQKKLKGRLTSMTVLLDFIDNIFSLNKSFFADLKLLLLKPDVFIHRYLNGFRNYHSSPAKFLIIASVFLALSFTQTDSNYFRFKIDKSELEDQFIFLFFFVFVFSFSSFLVFYYQWRKSYLENLIVNIYTISLWTILFIPLSMIDFFYVKSERWSWVFLMGYLLMIVVWNTRVFPVRNRMWRVAYVLFHCLALGMIARLFLLFGK